MNFALVNLGCKVNRVETEAFAAALLARGDTLTSEENADLILVNTCTVTGEAEKKTRKAVHHAIRANNHARIVVLGCAVAVDPLTYEAMDERVHIMGKDELLAEIRRDTRRHTNTNQILWEPACADRTCGKQANGSHKGSKQANDNHADGKQAGASQAGPLFFGKGFRTRVGVKVQDGCDNACTYCIVHIARGKARSRPCDEVVKECVSLALAGVREIVLTGINLGSYCDAGTKSPSAIRLAGLLERLLDATKDIHEKNEPAVRFRISSIEPRDVDEALITLLASAKGRVCRHLHLPLQSGSSKVLHEMARPYDAPAYVDLVRRLRARVGSLSLSTDVIVGFPGESDEEFQETLDIARTCQFSKIHVFPYSPRKNTPAAMRKDQIAPDIKAARAETLRRLSAELRRAEGAQRQGSTEFALVEEGGFAMTESYFKLPAPDGALPGSLIPLVFELFTAD